MTFDLALHCDLTDDNGNLIAKGECPFESYWRQMDEQFAGLHALASSFVPSQPTNAVVGRAHRCLGLVA